MSFRRSLLAASALLGLGIPGESRAQGAYPDRPIRVILPFAAGGGADIITRVFERLGRDSMATVADPACRQRLVEIGIEPVGSSPADFTAFWDSQIAYWGPVVRNSGVTLD